jgi:hypothetical protein
MSQVDASSMSVSSPDARSFSVSPQQGRDASVKATFLERRPFGRAEAVRRSGLAAQLVQIVSARALHHLRCSVRRHQHDGTPWNTAAYLLEQAQVSAIGQAEVQQGDIDRRDASPIASRALVRAGRLYHGMSAATQTWKSDTPPGGWPMDAFKDETYSPLIRAIHPDL